MMLGQILWVWLGILVHGQALITPPEQLAGPWEVAGPSRVDGIFVMISRSKSSATQGATRESIQVRMYYRQAGYESGGWHVVAPVPESAETRFDGANLRLLGLTATFDSKAEHWTGEWLFDGQPRKIVLERPRPAEGSTPNPFCGNWENVPDTTKPYTSVRIHIRQRLDGSFTSWMDTMQTIVPERVEAQKFGQSMKVVSADRTSVILQNESPIATQRGRFIGVLSDDGNSLAATWDGRATGSFRRIR